MKNTFLAMLVVVGLGTISRLLAAVTVSDVKVQQRWPWNGLVDIDYTLTCDTPEADIYVYPTAMDGDRRIALSPRTLTGDGASGPVKAGKHRMTWDMATDNPGLHSSAFTVTIHAYTGAAPYMIVDLTEGAEATHYPVTYANACPDLTDDAYKTTKMVFKLILPGTFMMGSPSTEEGRNANREQLHEVTLTKPYYMAIFECTRQQWFQVMGVYSYDETRGDGPARCVSWNDIRGTVAALTWPTTEQVDNTSFMGKLRMRTGLTFDLPTEAQWEYACRAGTSTRWAFGEETADINGQWSGALRVVGSFAPNAWGLYDMHGNVCEWCIDTWMEKLGSAAVTNPTGPAVDGPRVVRGGCWRTTVTDGRSASRSYVYRDDRDHYYSGRYGFRAVCRPGLK